MYYNKTMVNSLVLSLVFSSAVNGLSLWNGFKRNKAPKLEGVEVTSESYIEACKDAAQKNVKIEKDGDDYVVSHRIPAKYCTPELKKTVTTTLFLTEYLRNIAHLN